MNLGTYPLAANMINQLNRVDVLSNNLANSSTTAFKQDNVAEGSFNNYLKKAQETDQEVVKISQIANTIPKIDNHFISDELGAIVPTNNELDFALNAENTFFKIKNPTTGEILLTRNGSFNILNDQLVTKNGYQVLNADNLPIVTEEEFAQQIAVVKTHFDNLEKQGKNNYQIKSSQDIEALVDNTDYVLQGALEKSNVNTVLTMVSLIDSHRRFEQAQKAMTGIDDLNKAVIEKIGSAR